MLESEGYFIDEAKASLQDIYQKYYKDIPVNDFNKLVSADPTAKPNEMGKFGKWILNLYRNGKLKVGDTPELNYALSYFVKFYNKIEKKDINQYHSVGELYQVIKPFAEDPNQATSKTDANRKAKEEGAEKFYEDDTWLVVIPKTEEASCLYGKGTMWCTAATEGENMFNVYDGKGKLYININKGNNRKYQFHFESGQFMDEEDDGIEAPVAKTISLSDQLVKKYCQAYGLKAYFYLLTENDSDTVSKMTFKNVDGNKKLFILSYFKDNDTVSAVYYFDYDILKIKKMYQDDYHSINEKLIYGNYLSILDGTETLNLLSITNYELLLPEDSYNVRTNLKDDDYNFPLITFSNDNGTYLYSLESNSVISLLSNNEDTYPKVLTDYFRYKIKSILPDAYDNFICLITDKTVFNVANEEFVFDKPYRMIDNENKQYPTFIFEDGSHIALLPNGETKSLTQQSESKKILFSSESLMRLNEALNEEKELNKVELPKPLLNQLKKHRTSLGDNPAFPPEDETSFDYKLTLSHFKAISEHLETFDNVEDITNKDSLKTLLSTLVAKAIELEKPIREELERICFNFIIDKFGLPEDTVDFSCELTDTIDVSNKRLTPEETDGTVEFDGIREIKMLSKEVYKRRFINCLVQGASLYYSMQVSEYVQDIYKLNPKLPELYDEIMTLNTYLSFITNDEMDLKNPSSAGDVEVRLGNDVNKTSIESKGVVFPVLLAESIKGFMELFASHGLPDDMEQASYVIKKADFLLAEPWDIRLGVPLWEKFINKIPSGEAKLIPYIFSEYVSLPTEKFNETSQEIFENTKTGKEYINMLLKKIQYEIRKDDFDSFISKQSTDDVLISDGEDEYFTIEELIGG